MVNFTSFLDVNALHYGEKPAILFPKRGDVISYRELLERVEVLASGLERLGVLKGDRVIISTGSSPETIMLYLATWRIGAVAVPANPDYKVEEFANLIEDSDPKIIIALEPLRGILSEFDDRTLVSVDGVSEEGVRRPQSDSHPADCSLETVCQIQYTSGTTGRPKGAMLTHGNWMAAVEAERWALGLTDRDVYLGFYPHFHIGVSWGITCIRYGATFVIMERYKLEEFLRLAKEYRATLLSGMPPVLYALANAPTGSEGCLAEARCIITGGAPTPEETWRRFSERYPHISVVNAYGLSETVVLGAGTAVPWSEQGISKGFRSVGLPVGYSEVKIVDADDPTEEVEPGRIGEVAIRGPGVCKGYWRREEETRRSFLPGGWFLTGDLGYIDEEGVLYITSRKKDVIIMSGWKIYPAEVEDVLAKHPKVSEAAVFAKYDEVKGEVPAAAVVLRPGAEATAEEIVEYCRRRMAGYKVPRQIFFLESLPKMGEWKVLRRVLRERYGGFPESDKSGKIPELAKLSSKDKGGRR